MEPSKQFTTEGRKPVSRSAKKSFPVKVGMFLLTVVFVFAVIQYMVATVGIVGMALIGVAGLMAMRGIRSLRRRF